MTDAARPRRRWQRATAARQAIGLCEADPPQGTLGGQHRVTPVTTKAALRAAGVPPLIAAALRNRLRLIPDQEDQR